MANRRLAMAKEKRSEEEKEAGEEHAAQPLCVDAEFRVGHVKINRKFEKYLERRREYQESCWNDGLVLDGRVPTVKKR